MRVLHIITGLDTGGVETMLQRIIARSGMQHAVVSLTSVGRIGRELLEAGVDVRALGIRRRFPNLLALRSIPETLQAIDPDVVKSWMYHADLATVVTSTSRPIIWGVHNTSLDRARVRWSTRLAARLCARYSSRVPWKVVFDSKAGADVHVSRGYDAAKVTVIPNGFDVDAWRPRAGARESLRARLGLAHDAKVVGLVARFDPLKDHRNFVAAAAQVRRMVPDAHFVLCGGVGIDASNAELVRWIEEARLGDAVHLMGRVDDLPAVVAAFDVGVSASLAESFPLAVGEMMSTAVPCVVTDVGDSAYLVGGGGIPVPPRDPKALAGGIVRVLRMGEAERRHLGSAARDRVERLFSIDATVSAYERLFQEAAELPRGA